MYKLTLFRESDIINPLPCAHEKRGADILSLDNAVSARPNTLGMGGKMLVKVLLADFCCLILVISTAFLFMYQWLIWLLAIICMTLLVAFLAGPMNNRGHRDRGYYERNNQKTDRFYGLKAGLIAALPFYLMTLVSVLMMLGILPDYFLLYRALNSFFWPFISLIVGAFGVVDFPWYYFLLFFLLQSVIPLTCHISYTLGLKDIVLSDRILYQRNKKKK